jgi:hypothetical protein
MGYMGSIRLACFGDKSPTADGRRLTQIRGTIRRLRRFRFEARVLAGVTENGTEPERCLYRKSRTQAQNRNLRKSGFICG